MQTATHAPLLNSKTFLFCRGEEVRRRHGKWSKKKEKDYLKYIVNKETERRYFHTHNGKSAVEAFIALFCWLPHSQPLSCNRSSRMLPWGISAIMHCQLRKNSFFDRRSPYTTLPWFPWSSGLWLNFFEIIKHLVCPGYTLKHPTVLSTATSQWRPKMPLGQGVLGESLILPSSLPVSVLTFSSLLSQHKACDGTHFPEYIVSASYHCIWGRTY